MGYNIKYLSFFYTLSLFGFHASTEISKNISKHQMKVFQY